MNQPGRSPRRTTARLTAVTLALIAAGTGTALASTPKLSAHLHPVGHPNAGQAATIALGASLPHGDSLTAATLVFGDKSQPAKFKGSKLPKTTDHFYGHAGSYHATLTVTDTRNHTARATTTISITSPAPIGGGSATTSTTPTTTPSPTVAPTSPAPAPVVGSGSGGTGPAPTTSPTSTASSTPTPTATTSPTSPGSPGAVPACSSLAAPTSTPGVAGTAITYAGTPVGTISTPWSITVVGGTSYLTDSSQKAVYKATPAGVVTLVAGLPGVPGSCDGTGSNARFAGPSGITSDSTDLFVVDGSLIRRISIATGSVSTLTQPNQLKPGGGIATDGTYVYVSTTNAAIYRIAIATDRVDVFAGIPNNAGTTDGAAGIATFTAPGSLTVADGFLYLTDGNRLRRASLATGATSTLDANLPIGTSVGGQAITPGGLAVIGNAAYFYFGGKYSRFDLSTTAVSTVPTPQRWITDILGVTQNTATDGTSLYTADLLAGGYDVVDPTTGAVTRPVGNLNALGQGPDGSSGAADLFLDPRSITMVSSTVYVGDGMGLSKIDLTTGQRTTLASGLASGLYFGSLAADGTSVYFTNGADSTIRRYDLVTKTISILAGAAGQSGSQDGAATVARFNTVKGLATDGTYLYISDDDLANHRGSIRRLTLSTGQVTTITSSGLTSPGALALSGQTLYVADGTIIDQVSIGSGTVTTLAGTSNSLPANGATFDGPGSSATFNTPYGLTVDGSYLDVADGNALRRLDLTTHVVSSVTATPAYTNTQVIPGAGAVAAPLATASVSNLDLTGVIAIAPGDLLLTDFNGLVRITITGG